MKRIASMLIAAGFLAACGGQDATTTDVEAPAPEVAAAEASAEEVAEPECDPTDPDCDHTGTVNRPPD